MKTKITGVLHVLWLYSCQRFFGIGPEIFPERAGQTHFRRRDLFIYAEKHTRVVPCTNEGLFSYFHRKISIGLASVRSTLS